MDLSLIISIISLILVIPLGITTHILAPKFVDWYSNFSEEKLLKRIKTLKKQLDYRKVLKENCNLLLNFGILTILRALYFGIFIIFSYFALTFFSTALQEGDLLLIMTPHIKYFILSIITYVTSLLVYSNIKLFRELQYFYQYEKKISNRIHEFELKLSTTNNNAS
jgi:hypothetical protein